MDQIAEIISEFEELADEIYQGKIRNLALGEKRSGIIGDGRERYDVSEWEPGDPFNSIDWRLTLLYWPEKIFKTNRIENKQLPLTLALDASPSMLVRFRANESKFILMLRLAAILTFSSIRKHDPVAITAFGNPSAFFLPPSYGKGNIFYAAEMLLDDAAVFYKKISRRNKIFRSDLTAIDINECLADMLARVRVESLVVVISDFLNIIYSQIKIDEELLSALVARHKENVVFIILDDDKEFAWSGSRGTVLTRNIETGRLQEVKAGHAEKIRAEHVTKQVEFQKYLETQGIDSLILSSNNWLDRLLEFAASRNADFR